MKLQGVEDFIERHDLNAVAADQVREWAREALYWNILPALHPMDLATDIMGADTPTELQRRLVERIKRRLPNE